MPDFSQLAPATWAAITTLLVAIAAEGVVRASWLAARLPFWRRRALPLLREPGARFVRQRRRALAEALACAAAVVAGVTAGGVTVAVTAVSFWAPPTAAVIAIAMLAGLSLRMVQLLRRARRLSRQRDTRRRVAQALEAIGGERDRLFHDVNTGHATAIDHVLVGNQGAFAIVVADVPAARDDAILHRQGRRLRLGDTPRYLDEADITRHLNAVQHELSKHFGRMLSLRGVLCVPGWRNGDNRGDGLLVVGVSDVVMLQGWRTAKDALMTEDTVALHKLLAERESALPAPTRHAAVVRKIDAENPAATEAAPA